LARYSSSTACDGDADAAKDEDATDDNEDNDDNESDDDNDTDDSGNADDGGRSRSNITESSTALRVLLISCIAFASLLSVSNAEGDDLDDEVDVDDDAGKVDGNSPLSAAAFLASSNAKARVAADFGFTPATKSDCSSARIFCNSCSNFSSGACGDDADDVVLVLVNILSLLMVSVLLLLLNFIRSDGLGRSR
jgi:hypothetical protein